MVRMGVLLNRGENLAPGRPPIFPTAATQPSREGTARNGLRVTLIAWGTHQLDSWIWKKTHQLRGISGFLGDMRGILTHHENND